MENINLDKIIKADEVDFNMILNVPEDIGVKIHQYIQGQMSQEAKSKMKIEFIENPSDGMKIEDSRKMIFKMNNQLYPLTILDLPCIIEGNKTIDYKTYYKTGDISQMFYVHENQIEKEEDIDNFNPLKLEDENFKKILWKKDLDHKFKLKHGLAKCTRNIRSKRFKRKLRYNHKEILDVAKKLKSIIDNGAANYENHMNLEISRATEENNQPQSEIKIKNNNSNNGNNGINSINGEVKKSHHTRKNTNKTNQNNNNGININNISNSLSISLPLMLDSEQSGNVMKIEQELQNEEKTNIVNKYLEIKKEYAKIKAEIEANENPSKDIIKKKKAIKKELKALKAQYHEIK